MISVISFAQRKDLAFKEALHKRVNSYFDRTGLSRNHNPGMIVKTITMLTLYLAPFALILTGLFPVWMVMILFFIMGVGVAGVGMSVMHDGNHAGYSSNQNVNRLMGFTLNMLGGDAYNWKIKHNKLHHVFTNVYGKDEDIESRIILRFAFAAPLKPYHRFQFLYAWFFYALMTLSIIFGDIPKRIRYRRKGITNLSKAAYRRSMVWLVISKVLFFGAFFGLPLLLTDLLWWQVLIGFLIVQLTSGIILSVVFQMAHVVEGPHQAQPDDSGFIPDTLLVHQLKSTADFSRGNRILSWYVGGLNYQIEHHLFPRMCHMHYPAISPIVEETCKEFNMPFHVYDGFWSAIGSHVRTLKLLGEVKYDPVWIKK